MFIHLDFETRSKANLRNIGASFYSKDSSTNILCFAYSIDDNPVKLHKTISKFKSGNIGIPKSLNRALDKGATIVAHNARFEYLIWNNILASRYNWPKLSIDRFYCTMGLCSRHGLPKGLDQAAKALHLKANKDLEGSKIMLKMCKPRKPTKNNPDEWFFDEEMYKTLCAYCKQDVVTEKELFHRLIEVNPKDLEVWRLSQIQNDRGLCVDKKAIKNAISIVRLAQKEGNKRIQKLSKGRISTTNQTKVITKELSKYGIKSLAAKRIEEYLADPKLAKYPRKILTLRQKMTKTSVTKLNRLLERVESDGRVKDLTIYHGAITGRDTGVGPQPLNLPRGKMKYGQVVKALKLIRKNDVEELKKFGPLLHTISSCARSMFIAEKGKIFYCADLNAIEARLNFWLAGETKALNAFRKGEDIYKIMASEIYNVSIKQVTDDQRFIGKQSILGLGYGMGWTKFVNNMKMQFNIELDPEFAKRVVSTYRSTYPLITGGSMPWKSKIIGNWQGLEKAATFAIETPGKAGIYKDIWYVMRDDSLFCKLPSGRFLVYKYPGITFDGYGRKKIHYWSWSSEGNRKGWYKTDTYGGKLTENVIQSIARDLLVRAMLKLESENYPVVLSVYDEILCEVEKGHGSLEHMIEIMTNTPKWSKGLPLKAEGWTGKRYRKG